MSTLLIFISMISTSYAAAPADFQTQAHRLFEKASAPKPSALAARWLCFGEFDAQFSPGELNGIKFENGEYKIGRDSALAAGRGKFTLKESALVRTLQAADNGVISNRYESFRILETGGQSRLVIETSQDANGVGVRSKASGGLVGKSDVCVPYDEIMPRAKPEKIFATERALARPRGDWTCIEEADQGRFDGSHLRAATMKNEARRAGDAWIVKGLSGEPAWRTCFDDSALANKLLLRNDERAGLVAPTTPVGAIR